MTDQPIVEHDEARSYRHALRQGPLRDLGRVLRGTSTLELVVRSKDHQLVRLDYPVKPEPRYGWGKPAHPELYALLDARREAYESTLDTLASYAGDLARIPLEPGAARGEPAWNNHWFEGLDLIALYGLLASRRPRRYIEVGSGNSTLIARRAIRDHSLALHVTSIDPRPRADIDLLCDRVLRQPLEEVDLSRFDALEAGDVMFLDGSHRTLMNSDVTVALLEVLPRLKPGVLVHIHDVFLPYDYPPSWAGRYYSEQYLLAAWLLAGGDRLEVLLPAAFCAHDDALSARLDPVWARGPLAGVHNKRSGQSFWLIVR